MVKTLKDILYAETPDDGFVATEDDLRKSAIEWIKELQKGCETDGHLVSWWDQECGECSFCAKIEWIKHFFNITEDDLNEDAAIPNKEDFVYAESDFKELFK